MSTAAKMAFGRAQDDQVGRHGPGNNVFSYFIEPNGFVAEYTTELDQIDEATRW